MKRGSLVCISHIIGVLFSQVHGEARSLRSARCEGRGQERSQAHWLRTPAHRKARRARRQGRRRSARPTMVAEAWIVLMVRPFAVGRPKNGSVPAPESTTTPKPRHEAGDDGEA